MLRSTAFRHFLLPVLYFYVLHMEVHSVMPEVKCYSCIFNSADDEAKDDCVHNPDNAGPPVSCPADKSCAIKRKENKDGVLQTLMRNCRRKGVEHNGCKLIGPFKICNTFCQTDLCNKGDGTNPPPSQPSTTLSPTTPSTVSTTVTVEQPPGLQCFDCVHKVWEEETGCLENPKTSQDKCRNDKMCHITRMEYRNGTLRSLTRGCRLRKRENGCELVGQDYRHCYTYCGTSFCNGGPGNYPSAPPSTTSPPNTTASTTTASTTSPSTTSPSNTTASTTTPSTTSPSTTSPSTTTGSGAAEHLLSAGLLVLLLAPISVCNY